MGSTDAPPSQRTRSKASDFSELFRSAHGSRHSSRTGAAGTGSSPSSIPSSPVEKPAGTMKAPSRRSMLPFLGRKKPAEQPSAAPPITTSRKSVSNTAYAPVNTVRRSFGNGHAVLMITPSSGSPSGAPPLPSKLPSVDVHSASLGSKLAAHFTPLRSPSRSPKAYNLAALKAAASIPPPLPSPSALSPPVQGVRAPSIESQGSSRPSRSTTPRPFRGPPSPAAENGDEEDFSDLFTLPEPLKRLQQAQKSYSSTSVHIYSRDSPTKSGDLSPTTPITPTGPPLQFPIPPPMVNPPPRSVLTQKGLPAHSSELASLSSRGSRSPSKIPSPRMADGSSGRTRYSDMSSLSLQDDRRSSRYRATSVSGSDTDTSRANDSSYSASSRLSGKPVKPLTVKSKFLAPSAAKTSSGPPPSLPLPTPPLSPNPGIAGPHSAPNGSPNRVAFPRPRANTLSVTTNLTVPANTLSKPNYSSPITRTSRANSDVVPDATIDELRETLSQQSRKNAQLQEYIVTVTKRYEDDRMAMTRTIEKLERNIRKKMREIEGLRWLVIHNGAVSDIDAAANLARASFSTQDGDTFDGVRRSSQAPPIPTVPPIYNGGALPHQSTSGHQADVSGISATATATPPEVFSDASCSAASLSMSSASEATSLTTPPLSVIPERTDAITRAERQRLKEERRASKALRRISAASNFALGPDTLTHSSSMAESPVDPNFDPKQSMDEVLEKLEPFRDT